NAFPQSLTVDLGSAKTVGRLVLKLPAGWGARTENLSVLGSTNNSSYTTLKASAGYTFDPGSADTVTVGLTPTSTRYLRLTFTANTGWPAGQLSELEAYAS
ncbi:F5/8 type C domain-containing protein, partial [Streptomyces sp. DvalAA-14]|uniref:discoidin domain-containing protein n=1 Tax=unclassified Streptomyces TaxID=2593676 RepID=UPI00081B737B